MPPAPYCPLPERTSLNAHLFRAKAPDLLRHLINDISRATKYIHYAIRTTEAGLAGTRNQFGEEQVKLDVLSDEIIRQHLCENQIVASFSSEEMENVIELDPKAPYSVVYDPLDGSSLVDVNFAIGSIFGIYAGKDILNRTPREQAGALYVLYGPRTILVYSIGQGVHEFILNDVGEFILLRENLGVADKAKNFSPGNLRAVTDTPAYRDMMSLWLDEKLTLRYSGCMVADIHHILSKGQGVFTNVGGSKYPQGKLRLAFECGPFAYLMENAGGVASNGTDPILDVRLRETDQRTPIIIGSKEEVERVCGVLRGK
ncbi:MAG: class 1 fructose-bisphosphatase [Patescibacteria group bacterium]|mgnify:CR=1 FL=1